MAEQPSSPSGPDLSVGVPAASLQEGIPVVGPVADDQVLQVRRGAEVLAIGASCTHYGGPLVEGLVVDETVRCPWHHACFSLRTGEAVRAPALTPVPSYVVVEKAGVVAVTGKREGAVPPRPSPRRGTAPASVAIVGAGAGGNSTAESLRRHGFDGRITLIGREEDAPYDRPNLSKDYLAGKAPEEWIPLHPRSYYGDLGVELVLGRRVTRLEAASRRLTLDDGTTRDFGAIVLATGAEPVRLTLPGVGGPPVHVLRTLGDSRAIIRAAEGARRVVVIGASFIGLEVAASLRTRGLEVHVVAPQARPLERVLGPELGAFVRTLHETQGVVFHLGRTADHVQPGEVVLQDGQRLPADFVVTGVGVRPATALAEQARLHVDQGIVVDSHLETTAPGIFAIGDAARWPDPRGGGLVRIEHWVLAQRQGQAVGRTLAGDRAPFRDVPFFWSAHYDVSINYVGHAERWDAIEIDGSLERRDAIVRYRENRALRAVASVFRDRESLQAELAMEQAS